MAGWARASSSTVALDIRNYKRQQLSLRSNSSSPSNTSHSTTNSISAGGLLYLSIFGLGLIIGHFHGRASSYYYDGDYQHFFQKNKYWALKTIATTPPLCSDEQHQHLAASSSSSWKITTPGWNSIDVYYGKTDHVESQLTNQTQQWFSQGRQDEVVLALLRHAKDHHQDHHDSSSSSPIFIDLAANDATLLSNTYALERFHGWQGFCIEPNPLYWYNLTHYRPNCTIISAVVGGGGGGGTNSKKHNNNNDINSSSSSSQLVSFLYSAGDHGGIADTGFDNGKKFQRHAVKEYTIPLLHILERYQVPRIIDYLSLDVEGAEEFILQDFPLDLYQFRVLTIERVEKKPNLKAKLLQYGYVSLIRLTRWGDSLWAHQSVIQGMTQEELDSILDEFDVRKQRLLARKQTQEKQQQPHLQATITADALSAS
jgi:hypothetical protein